ncbi:MAG: flagellar protein FlgN [bacterium]
MEGEALERLKGILGDELTAYRTLLDLTNRKREALLEKDLDLIDDLTNSEESIIEQVKELERARIDCTKRIADSCNISFAEFNFDSLLKIVDDSERAQYSDLKDALIKTTNELQDANDLNARLIQQSLDYINYSLKLFTDLRDGDTTYGRQRDRGESIAFDRKI